MGKIIISAGVVPVRLVDGEYQYLLLRSWGTFYDFPKGRMEDGETPLSTALRETYEESTIDDLDFKWGKDSYKTKPFKGHQGKKIGQYFVAETQKEKIELPISPELGAPEHDGYIWVTYEEGQKLTNYRIGGVLKWARDKIGA